MARMTKEKFKTEHTVFDDFTNRTLFKLISRGHFEGLYSPVRVGKESNVFTAKTKDDTLVIVKIYRLETADFTKMYNYIKDDPRFISLSKNRRKVIFAWCQREYRNLLNARDAGMQVPTPYAFLHNVLVMEMIGGKDPAPMLKDMLPNDMKQFFDKIIAEITLLYKAGFVHGDLSHFNILNHLERPYIIDFSQCTSLSNPHATQLLKRDIEVISSFFERYGLTVDKEKLYKQVVG